MEYIKKLKQVIKEVNKVYDTGVTQVFNENARELIDKCGINELLLVGCKIVRSPSGKQYVELPYKGIDTKRIDSLFDKLLKTGA